MVPELISIGISSKSLAVALVRESDTVGTPDVCSLSIMGQKFMPKACVGV